MINIKQVNLEEAQRAFYGTSWTPEKRGQQVVNDYNKAIAIYKKSLIDEGLWIEENADIIQSCFNKYYELFTIWLSRKSRCMSAAVVGPAKFPVRSNQKKLDSEERACKELCAFDIEKEVKRRLAKRKRNQETQTRVESGQYEIVIIFQGEGYKVVNNKALERVQIFFDNKPGPEIRQKLKNRAFRFSRKNDNAWQRKNTVNGIWAAKHVIEEIDSLTKNNT